VTKNLTGLLRGEFMVAGTPALALNQKERSQLRKVVTDVIVEKASGMTKDDKVDLGPMILAQFPSWTSKTDVKRDPQPQIVKTADELWLFKISDRGCSVEPAASPPDVFYITEAITEAICGLLDQNEGGMLKANQQLGLAKEMGAKETILLLDCHFPWRPNTVKEVLAGKDLNSMSNVDVIYLIEASHKRVAKVWRSKIRINA